MIATLEWSAEKILASLPKDPDELLAFKCPPDLQRRVDELRELSNSNRLDDDTREEIERFLKLDSDILLRKAKVLEARNKAKKVRGNRIAHPRRSTA